MRDLISVMRSPYEPDGDELIDDTVQRIRRWLAEHPQDRFGSAACPSERYGLIDDGIGTAFDEYFPTFDSELHRTE
ncbi:hypothetical protein [Mycobacterium neumannii]|uniref:hypothetical protein n=1 Tax=Mycobacterium neumannii TaxID=2048551 RepID=UPI001EE42F5A|nr:hypothetical protein [Mycobacterium neumannii]